jgi:hypothetical protein
VLRIRVELGWFGWDRLILERYSAIIAKNVISTSSSVSPN